MTTAPPASRRRPREPPHQRARYFRIPRKRRLWPAIVGWSLCAIIGFVVAISAGAYIYLDDTLAQAAPEHARGQGGPRGHPARCCPASRSTSS